MSEKHPRQPVMIDLDSTAPRAPTPAEAPPVPEPLRGSAMDTATLLVARKPSLFGRLFVWALLALTGIAVSVAFWDFAAAMLARNLWLGRGLMGLLAVLLLALGVICLREVACLFRLRKMDRLRRASDAVAKSGGLDQALRFQHQLESFYSGRSDLQWGLEDLQEQRGDLLDADAVLNLLENRILAPLDKAATGEIEAASRRVAIATALVPLAFADVIVALTANLRMIRAIAEIYGGRSGFFGSWRLTRAVAAHLVATGAVAIGDDMIGSLAGGGVLSKLSRRFGEGLINGALTARVGIAAMDVSRPMPFVALPKPKTTAVVRKALTGLFG